MADAKHTPGPWRSNWNGYYFEVIVGPQEFDPIICQVMVNVVALQQTRNDAEANARLIAAAPDMIEALRQMVANTEADGKEYRDCYKKAVAAIAKAEGRS